jgi:hypothetical protein
MVIDRSHIRKFETGDWSHFWVGIREGLHLFLRVTRASFPAYEDVFAMTLLALCPDRPPREDGPFTTRTRLVVEVSASDDGFKRCRSFAVVCFDGEEVPAVRSLALL